MTSAGGGGRMPDQDDPDPGHRPASGGTAAQDGFPARRRPARGSPMRNRNRFMDPTLETLPDG
jgi:hypothetical protein